MTCFVIDMSHASANLPITFPQDGDRFPCYMKLSDFQTSTNVKTPLIPNKRPSYKHVFAKREIIITWFESSLRKVCWWHSSTALFFYQIKNGNSCHRNKELHILCEYTYSVKFLKIHPLLGFVGCCIYHDSYNVLCRLLRCQDTVWNCRPVMYVTMWWPMVLT